MSYAKITANSANNASRQRQPSKPAAANFASVNLLNGQPVKAAQLVVFGPNKNMLRAVDVEAEKHKPLAMLSNVEKKSVALTVNDPVTTPHFSVILPEDFLKTDPKTLAAACGQLIDTLHDQLGGVGDFRLSYLPAENQLRLKIPPVVWYDRLLGKTSNSRVLTARQWIDKTKLTDTTAPFHDPRTQFIEVTLPEACRKGVDCPFWLTNERFNKSQQQQRGPAFKMCDRVHYWRTCAALIQQRDQDHVHCNFRVPDELVISQDLDPRFVLMGRQDDLRSRDILFTPKPARPWPFAPENEPTKFFAGTHPDDDPGHCENEQFVSSPDVWEFVQSVVSQILKDGSDAGQNMSDIISEVAYNFGGWETKISQDKLALECHAHGHIILTENAQKNLLANDTYRSVLVGRHAPPFPYDLDDANTLESTRVVGDELKAMDGKLEAMGDELKAMDGKLDRILSLLQK